MITLTLLPLELNSIMSSPNKLAPDQKNSVQDKKSR